MSKKTRKKSPKLASPKASGSKASRSKASGSEASRSKASPGRSLTSAKTPASKTRRAKNTGKKSAKATAGASHKAPSKQLKKANQPIARESILAERAPAPAFRLPRDGGATVSLSDYAGKKLVLFFYPRADTPGCTREAIDFTRLASAFATSQTAVLGVSADPPRTQEAFRNKHQLAIPLVSDEKHEMLEAYGAWGEKSMYGKTFKGILRTTVLIGADGKIARIWRNVRVDGHADEVLAAAQAL
jgi:peroxiredoxin Q/BCP